MSRLSEFQARQSPKRKLCTTQGRRDSRPPYLQHAIILQPICMNRHCPLRTVRREDGYGFGQGAAGNRLGSCCGPTRVIEDTMIYWTKCALVAFSIAGALSAEGDSLLSAADFHAGIAHCNTRRTGYTPQELTPPYRVVWVHACAAQAAACLEGTGVGAAADRFRLCLRRIGPG